MFIGTEKLTHTYMPGTPFSTEALKGVTFGLERGQFALIIGPSGSGKSTLIQHFNGLLKPRSGRVFFSERPVGSNKAELLQLRRKVGLVFQMPEEQFFSESVFDEVAFAPRNLGLAEEVVRERVAEALARVGLKDQALQERHPFQLSAGQKRLVAIAAVLSLEPEVLILDEPTAGLDPGGRIRLFNLLEELNCRSGLTVIVSTHHLNTLAALADRVMVLKEGRVVLCGSADEVFSKREELYAIGLSLPDITEIMCSLAEEGLPVSRAVYSLSAARRELNSIKEQCGL